jgi:SAM-dependent methyltransferase
LPAASLGADVLGVDIASNLVQAGNARAQRLGITNCRFQQGDATDLNELEDDRFDLLISIFGAMFAPRPFDVAKEMVRVTRPGGRIVMGNWIANDPTFVAQLLKISAAYSPPPPAGFVSPVSWGVEDNVIERFAAAGLPEGKVSFERATYTFHFRGRPMEFLAELSSYYCSNTAAPIFMDRSLAHRPRPSAPCGSGSDHSNAWVASSSVSMVSTCSATPASRRASCAGDPLGITTASRCLRAWRLSRRR